MIQASIPEVYRSLFDYQIVEANIYVISKLSVKFNMGPILSSYQNHMMEFNVGTEVKLCWAYGMPTTGASFSGSTDVHKLDNSFKYLVGKLQCLFLNVTLLRFIFI
jgi:hypothetical protein